MKHYLVDTNIVIDMLLDRDGAEAACAVFDGAERGEYTLHLCALSITNIYYSLRKYLTHDERIACLIQLQSVLHVLPVNISIINQALHSGWTDFEDAIQNFTALSDERICGIITRNTKDFQKSELEIIHSLEFITI